MALKKSPVVQLFWKIHPRLYQWTGGRIGGTTMGLPVLLLRTTGRKSGQPRTNALMYFARGDAYVVIASYLGEPRHPAWWLNAKANSDVEIQVGAKRIPVRAREAEGDERDAIWTDVVAQSSDYAEYQSRTERRIPVVVLDPRA